MRNRWLVETTLTEAFVVLPHKVFEIDPPGTADRLIAFTPYFPALRLCLRSF